MMDGKRRCIIRIFMVAAVYMLIFAVIDMAMPQNQTENGIWQPDCDDCL